VYYMHLLSPLHRLLCRHVCVPDVVAMYIYANLTNRVHAWQQAMFAIVSKVHA